ncbi:MAG: NFYB/HAP3 family transcription factor subunit [Candidatus Thermoplasmatota archaeon]|jgi:histone H3/H4|nr:NFYB/HAP3 family transcription factor subunit [Candidatus Thermoplasmatota archaeon]
MSELSFAALERIMKKAGAQRVSAAAIEALAQAMEDYGATLSTEATTMARHAGRKTVKREDVRLAERHVTLK